MLLKSILLGTTNWFRSRRYEDVDFCDSAIDDEGLLADTLDDTDPVEPRRADRLTKHSVPVHAVTAVERRDSAEKIQEGFNRLVEQLQKVNEHLNRQLDQHEEMMTRVRQLPQLLESLPSMVDNQRQLTAQLVEQLQATALRQEQFLDAVERIPNETLRQSKTLDTIHNQLELSAQTDSELVACFNTVERTLDRVGTNTADNTAGMHKLRKSAAARDRYLAFVLSKLQRRMAWLFGGVAVLCLAVISVLVGFVLYL
jgi:hypothetical protein